MRRHLLSAAAAVLALFVAAAPASPAGPRAQTAPPASLSALLPPSTEWKATEPARTYDPTSLFEYIDGAAEAYIGYVVLGGALSAFWLNVVWMMAGQLYWEKSQGNLELYFAAQKAHGRLTKHSERRAAIHIVPAMGKREVSYALGDGVRWS